MEVAEGTLTAERGDADALRNERTEGAAGGRPSLSGHQTLSGLAILYPVAIARVALIGSFSTLHNAVRLRSRGRQ